ncbi:antitoxin [Pseudonocardia oceani]|uniref:Antitoxin n=1 Tax=Pseudonocardia oceani TaxID=2792013 RepID=A0ABS6UBD7_9PSEU|nr:antitoxin [Pseudonocardia oceani]MBW0129179.1 antitoxin [Pseudonocardia oceani]
MALFRRLATLATAAEAARRYAKSNPDKAGKYLDQAAAFVDKQTKGKYRTQIDGVAKKAKGVAGLPTGPGATGNGHDAPTQVNPPADGPTTQGYRPPQPGPREHGA